MPNLKKVGLLPDRLLPKYDMLGISNIFKVVNLIMKHHGKS